MPSRRISSAAARRIARLDYEEWFQSQVAKGLADLDTGRILSHAKVLKELARRKAAFARALKKA
jgi:predicted transcriptional regulator